MKTNIPNVFVAGSCASARNYITNKDAIVREARVLCQRLEIQIPQISKIFEVLKNLVAV